MAAHSDGAGAALGYQFLSDINQFDPIQGIILL